MGRDRGFIAIDSAIATGADIVLIPEVRFDIGKIIKNIKEGMEKKKLHHLIVCAEGAIHARDLEQIIKSRLDIEIRVSVLGYIQRGGSPTRFDRIIATLFAERALTELIQGETGKVVGIKDNQIVLIPAEDAVTKQKDINSSLYKIIEEVSV
jgi:6-phosphofructokinase 1